MKRKAGQHFSISAFQRRGFQAFRLSGVQRRILLVFCLFPLSSFLFPPVFAQLATGINPEQVADDAVRAWLETPQTNLMDLAGRPPEEVCAELPQLLASPAPPEGSSVNFEDRKEQETSDENVRRYTYSATLPVRVLGRDAGEGLEVISVTLTREGDTWQAQRISYQSLQQPGGMSQWLQTRTASVVFIAFTLYILFLLVNPTSFLRKWLVQGRTVIRAHRGLVIGTMVALYLIFGLGMLTGSRLPPTCQNAVMEVLTTAITMTGATQAYGSQNLATAAAVTFYQNFGVVSLSLLFGSGLFFGFLAYLIAAFQFFSLGIPFGFSLGGGFGQLIFLLVLLLLELTAYFLIVAGGGILLVTVVRKGIRGFSEGVRNLALMLPFAMLLLLLGAWYEAGVIILPQLFGP